MSTQIKKFNFLNFKINWGNGNAREKTILGQENGNPREIYV